MTSHTDPASPLQLPLFMRFWCGRVSSATALLPIFVKDVLHVCPLALGLLRAAPAVGALLMSVVLALSVTLFEKMPLQQAFPGGDYKMSSSVASNQLILF